MPHQNQLHTIRLSVSCVYFDTNQEIFENTIQSLLDSITFAKKNKIDLIDEIHLINNNPLKEKWFIDWSKHFENKFDHLVLHTGHGNVGYGCGNNLAILNTKSEYHLILNPDVILARDNIFHALLHMQTHPDTDLIAADAFDNFNNRLYLVKRQPTILVLLARALNIKWVNKILQKPLFHYEYRDLIPSETPVSIELISGCYMLLNTRKLQTVKGFNEKYFMYFEDFDLSQKLDIKFFVPTVKIIHLGGNTARKNKRHFIMFCISMIRFLLTK